MTETTVHTHAAPAAKVEGHAQTHQQHPIGLYLVVWLLLFVLSTFSYLVVWGWLFVLSTFSYLVDYFHLQGYLRWTLILVFMMLKAGLIVAFFMHMKWERLTLIYAMLLPPLAVLVFVAIMAWESDYTLLSRVTSMGTPM